MVSLFVPCLFLIVAVIIHDVIATTRFVLDPLVGYPIPLDLCITIQNHYVQYSCSVSNNVLIKSNYTSNDSCSSSNPLISYEYKVNSTSNIEFNCIGEDNYMIQYEYVNQYECQLSSQQHLPFRNISKSNYNAKYIATNVCYKPNNSETYSLHTCNQYYSQQNIYQSNICAVSNNPLYLSFSSCNEHGVVLRSCIQNDTLSIFNESDVASLPVNERRALIDIYFSIHNYGKAMIDNNNNNEYLTQNCSIIWNLNTLIYDGELRAINNNYNICNVQLGYYNDQLTTLSIKLVNVALYNGLQDTICNLKHLKTISIGYDFVPNGSLWSLPPCIGTDIFYLETLQLINTNINGELPQLGSNALFKTLHLENNPYFTGTIPYSICNADYLSLILNHSYIYGIPSCDTSIALIEVTLINMNRLEKIPDWIFCNPYLQNIYIENVMNLETQNIPTCFSRIKPYLKSIIITSTSFEGSMPSLPYSPILNTINIACNHFEGSLSQLFYSYTNTPNTTQLKFNNDAYNDTEIDVDYSIINNFRYILLNNNNFNEEEVSNFLDFVWTKSPMLEILSIANNINVHGSIPKIPEDEYVSLEMTQFAGHNCDLYGTLPEILPFQLDYISLFNNRLSGDLPKKIGSNDDINSFLLLGNLFSDGDVPSYLNNSPFPSAPNITITIYRQFIEVIIFIFAFIAIIISIYSIRKLRNAKYQEHQLFFRRIDFINSKVGSYGMLICIVMLIALYPGNAKYYEVISFESYLSIIWYYIDNNDTLNGNGWIDWFLLVFVTFFQLITLNMALKLLTDMDIDNNIRVNVNSKLIQSYKQSMTCVQYIKHSLLFIVYFSLHIIVTIIIAIYFISLSLPSDNPIFPAINVLMPIILVIHNNVILKQLLRSFGLIVFQNTNYIFSYSHQQIIIFVSFFQCIFIPFIIGILFHQNCGRNWVQFWNNCIDDTLINEFDIKYNEYQLLSSSDICDSVSIFDDQFNWNKCVRSLFYEWSYIMILMIICDFIGSLSVIVYKLWLVHNKKQIKLNIDPINQSLIINLIIAITISTHQPVVIPIYLSSSIILKYLHKMMIKKYEMEIYSENYDEDNHYIHIQLIWFGIILAQIFNILFFICCIRKPFPITMLTSAIIIMDFAIIRNIKQYRSDSKTVSDDRPSITPIVPDNTTKTVLPLRRPPIRNKVNTVSTSGIDINVNNDDNNDTKLQYEEFDIGIDTKEEKDDIKNEMVQRKKSHVDPDIKRETDKKPYAQWIKAMKKKMNRNSTKYSGSFGITKSGSIGAFSVQQSVAPLADYDYDMGHQKQTSVQLKK